MKKSKGLSRGIDALFQDLGNLETVDIKDNTVVQLPLSELRPSPYQPRKTFEEISLQELANSIEQSDVLQPIIVRRSAVKGYEIIAGEGHFRTSKLAEKEAIPAIIGGFDKETMVQVAMLENLQREDLNPLGEAEACEMLMKDLKLTQAEVADRLGKSKPYIANYLHLLSLPDLVREVVQGQRLSMGQARTPLDLKSRSLILKLANRAVTENLTVRRLEQIVSELNQNDGKEKKKIPRPAREKPYCIRENEGRLMDKFGTSITIQEKNGKGKIETRYLSQEDLTRIFDILSIQSDEE